MESIASLSPPSLSPLSEAVVIASLPFVGRWQRLVSTTNWEKGRIISQWRQSLEAERAPATEYSDEAWSQLVGGVSGQHVGRLRRVYQRFAGEREKYPDLFWSHFQAALDWDDAEMWLEGAARTEWSVARMRQQRAETLGLIEASPTPPAGDLDEDADAGRTHPPVSHLLEAKYDQVNAGPRPEDPDFGDDDQPTRRSNGDAAASDDASPAVDLVRPFENVPELPDDLAEAFDSMKLAILRHKTGGWREVSAGNVLLALDALKALTTAPSAEIAPF